MSATLAYNDLVPQASALPKLVSTALSGEAVTEKPGFFARMLEAIGRAYCVETPDGQVICLCPPM